MKWDGPGEVRRAQDAECLLQKVRRVSPSPCLRVFSCQPFACLFPTESGRLVSCLDLLVLALAVLSLAFRAETRPVGPAQPLGDVSCLLSW